MNQENPKESEPRHIFKLLKLKRKFQNRGKAYLWKEFPSQ